MEDEVAPARKRKWPRLRRVHFISSAIGSACLIPIMVWLFLSSGEPLSLLSILAGVAFCIFVPLVTIFTVNAQTGGKTDDLFEDR